MKVNELLRLYVVNAGPNRFSAFHVVGGIFERVFVDGSQASPLVGVQTVSVPVGGGSIFEIRLKQAGEYPRYDWLAVIARVRHDGIAVVRRRNGGAARAICVSRQDIEALLRADGRRHDQAQQGDDSHRMSLHRLMSPASMTPSAAASRADATAAHARPIGARSSPRSMNRADVASNMTPG